MAMKLTPLSERPAWKALEAHHQKIQGMELKQLFASDPERGDRFTLEAAGLFLDYSKNRITDETLKLLVQLAEESGLRARIDAMFGGEKINITENRAVLHVALRAPKGEVDSGGWGGCCSGGACGAGQDGWRLPIGCAVERGRGIRASGFAM